MSEAAGGAERREHTRVEERLETRVIADGKIVQAESLNISEGGILLAGADFPDAGRVRLEIELAELGWHAVDAEVIRRGEDASGAETLAARFARVATEGGRQAIQAFFEARLGSAPPAA
ncbi:MAG: PilZ domain [Miltoncostaeaceae bacterium]|jgi:riboflavin biosynthesis pyrimidine reductase|nr:PilZ domain [Miltoncostaeaceae bacterium]